MNKRETKRLACSIVAQLIIGYIQSGNVADWPEANDANLERALQELSDELYRRAGS